MVDLALIAIEATGADRMLVERVRTQLNDWRVMRNDICHNAQAYKKYVERALSLKSDIESIVQILNKAVRDFTDSATPQLIASVVGKIHKSRPP